MTIDQAEAARRFTETLARVNQVVDQAQADYDAKQVSWSDALTRLTNGLTEALDVADPLDPADAAILRHRPTYPTPTAPARADRVTANQAFAKLMFPDLGSGRAER